MCEAKLYHYQKSREMPATVENKPARKKLPRELAVIFADNCTGCEACVAICPVDCIHTITLADGAKGIESWCEVDLDRCIGCRLCVRLPRRDKSDPYQMLVCPWEAIEMVPVAQVGDAIRGVGGRPDYVAENQDRLAELAQRQVDLLEKKTAK
jgi:electron transport complex protein RnfB